MSKQKRVARFAIARTHGSPQDWLKVFLSHLSENEAGEFANQLIGVDLSTKVITDYPALSDYLKREAATYTELMQPAELAQNPDTKKAIILLDSLFNSAKRNISKSRMNAEILAAPLGQEYVDPYLFETGHFESREEYEELSRTAKIKPRAKA